MWRHTLIRPGLDVDWDELLQKIQTLDQFESFNYSDPVLCLDFSSQPNSSVLVEAASRIDSYVRGSLYVRLWDYVDDAHMSGYGHLEAPIAIDFTVLPNREFHKVTTNVWKGDILEQIFYAEFDEQTQAHSTPVVRRSYSISYNPAALLIHVTETLAWYRRDGSLHPTTKTMHRYYNGQRYWVWWQGKREQTIEWLRHNVAMAMIANLLPQGWTIDQIVAEGHVFYDRHGGNIYAFTSGGGDGLSESISTDPRSWLDLPWPWNPAMTIREKFLEQIAP